MNTIPSIHTYQQGEYERLVAQLACEYETWDQVSAYELLPIYDAALRKESRSGWDPLIYHDDDCPEGETILCMIRSLLPLQSSKEGRANIIGNSTLTLFNLLDRFTRNLANYYDDDIRADFECERATLDEAGKPWWKRREFKATREMINDRKRGEK